MQQKQLYALLLGTLLAAAASAALADEMTPTSYATSFEPAQDPNSPGYVLGLLAPDGDPAFNQPGGANWWENWLCPWGHLGVVVTDEQAHIGTQAIKYTGNPNDPDDPYSGAEHIMVLDADPCDPNTGEWRPVVWEQEFSVYVPWELPHGVIALRAEPWNNWTRLCGDLFGQWEGYAYQFFIYRVDDGLADGWYPQIGIDAQANDLRDEMGMDPLFDAFACDTWWTVSIVADGESYTVMSVTISDDVGNVLVADSLTDCFSSWGEPCPGEGGDNYCSRPERVTYYGHRDVFLDDVSLHLVSDECPGDLDGDGDVDLADLAQLLSHYGMTEGATYEDGDLDGDGDVDLSDLAALLAEYGTVCW
jgi:hypothetical protein